MEVKIVDVEADIASETGVIGTILQHPEFIFHSDFLRSKHFTDPVLSTIYECVSRLYCSGVDDIDTFMVSNELMTDNKFKTILEQFGLKDIGIIADRLEDYKMVSRGSSEDYKALAKKVIGNAFKRDSAIKLVETANNIARSDEDINVLNRRLQTDISDFSSVYITNEEVKTLGEKADRIMNEIKMKQQRGFFGYPTMIPELNKYVSYTEEDLVCFQAKAKSYKSMFLMNQAITLAMNDIPTFYIDTENSETLHFMRALSFLTGIEFLRIRDGKLSDAEEKLIAEKVEMFKKVPYVHIYDNIADLDEIYTRARTLQIRMGLKVICHDYLKNTSSNTDDYNILGQNTMKLKNLCGDLKLAGITACQSNRNGDVGDSIKLLRYVSTMVKLERKSKEDIIKDGGLQLAGNLRMSVTDNRNGNSHFEGEWINISANGDKCRLRQAKLATNSDSTPFDN